MGFATFEGVVVGTSALNKSTMAYRKNVFQEAGTSETPGAYRYQLDLVHLLPAHRQNGVLTKLMGDLLPIERKLEFLPFHGSTMNR